jgi:formylmethanofuran dehydrogenase subunit E
MTSLQQKIATGDASDEDQTRLGDLRLQMENRMMALGLDDIFDVMAPKEKMPRSARILESLVCDECGEATMESRTRRFTGKTLCQPCFDLVEQK